MNQQTDSTQINSQINSAQDSIIQTISKFEDMLTGLVQAVEQARHRIENVSDLGMRSKDEILQIRDALMPFYEHARSATQRVVGKVRANPRTIGMVLAGVVGGLFLWSYYQNKPQLSAPAEASIH